MHHEDIKASIRKSGSSPARIARHLKVSPATVSNVIKGHTVSARIAQHISQVTGKRFSELWPGKYLRLSFVEAFGMASASAAKAEAEVSRAAASKPARRPAQQRAAA